MDIAVRGRRTEVTDRFRAHVESKLGKLERLDRKVMRIDVEVIHEPNPRLAASCERVELTCRSRGPVIRAEAEAADMYAALDLAYGRLEERLRRAADRRHAHRGANHGPVTVGEVLAGTDPMPAARPDAESAEEPSDSADGVAQLVVREKSHASKPMRIDQALHEMELVGHDFYLFWDAQADRASVVYRRRGYQYGVLRLEH